MSDTQGESSTSKLVSARLKAWKDLVSVVIGLAIVLMLVRLLNLFLPSLKGLYRTGGIIGLLAVGVAVIFLLFMLAARDRQSTDSRKSFLSICRADLILGVILGIIMTPICYLSLPNLGIALFVVLFLGRNIFDVAIPEGSPTREREISMQTAILVVIVAITVITAIGYFFVFRP